MNTNIIFSMSVLMFWSVRTSTKLNAFFDSFPEHSTGHIGQQPHDAQSTGLGCVDYTHKNKYLSLHIQ